MSLQLQQIAVGTTPTPLGSFSSPGCLTFSNPGAAAVFIGGPYVTVGAGFPVPAGQCAPFPQCGNTGPLYAIAVAAAVLSVGFGTLVN